MNNALLLSILAVLSFHFYYVHGASTNLPTTNCAGTPRSITDYSKYDFVIVSLRAMCSTERSLKRIFGMYNPRRIHYITGYAQECPGLEKLVGDERFKCWDENNVFSNVTTKHSLKKDCLELTRDTEKTFGWHMQQFVKLGVARHLSDLSEKYIIFDADNILLYPEEMIGEGGNIYLPYKPIAAGMGYDFFYAKTFRDRRPAAKENYVIGHMVFDKVVVLEMLDEIDKIWGATFPKSICEVAKKNDLRDVDTHFSEYFFYASFLKNAYPNKIAKEYYWYPSRNPPNYQSLAWKGDCCVREEAVCQSFKNTNDFYVIIEEHKFRYRDQVCTDGWTLS
jgi:hypothetical protein